MEYEELKDYVKEKNKEVIGYTEVSILQSRIKGVIRSDQTKALHQVITPTPNGSILNQVCKWYEVQYNRIKIHNRYIPVDKRGPLIEAKRDILAKQMGQIVIKTIEEQNYELHGDLVKTDLKQYVRKLFEVKGYEQSQKNIIELNRRFIKILEKVYNQAQYLETMVLTGNISNPVKAYKGMQTALQSLVDRLPISNRNKGDKACWTT